MWAIQQISPWKDGWISRQIIVDRRSVKCDPLLHGSMQESETCPISQHLKLYRVSEYTKLALLSHFLLTGITVVGKRALSLPTLQIRKWTSQKMEWLASDNTYTGANTYSPELPTWKDHPSQWFCLWHVLGRNSVGTQQRAVRHL